MARHNAGPSGSIQLRRRKLTMRNLKQRDDSPVEIWLSPNCRCYLEGEPYDRAYATIEWTPCTTCGAKATRYTRPGFSLKGTREAKRG